MSLPIVARYMVIKALAGRREVVDALYWYFVLNASPSHISDELGVDRNRLRGYVQRVLEMTLSFHKAKVLIKYLYPHVVTIAPLVNGDTCTACGAWVPSDAAEIHVRLDHQDVVDSIVEKVIDELKRGYAKKLNARGCYLDTRRLGRQGIAEIAR